jgi:hypothetical protein
MSFFRHGEIYRSDVGPRQDREQLTLSLLPALIGFDEFPVGYSLAGCPPAEPPPLYRPETILHNLKLAYSLFFAEFVR